MNKLVLSLIASLCASVGCAESPIGVITLPGTTPRVQTTLVNTTSNYFVLSTDRMLELYCTNQTININSPNYVDGPALVNGNTLIIKNMVPGATNTISAFYIDGASSYKLTNQFATIVIRYDGGTNWCVTSKVATP